MHDVQAMDLVSDVGADNVVVHLDTYHMNIEEASVSRAVKLCGDKLGCACSGPPYSPYPHPISCCRGSSIAKGAACTQRLLQSTHRAARACLGLPAVNRLESGSSWGIGARSQGELRWSSMCCGFRGRGGSAMPALAAESNRPQLSDYARLTIEAIP